MFEVGRLQGLFPHQLRNDTCTLSLRGAQWCHVRSIWGLNARRSSQPPFSSHALRGEAELELALHLSTGCLVRAPSQIDATPVGGLGLPFVHRVEALLASGGPQGPAISKLPPSSKAARHKKGRGEPQHDEHEPRAVPKDASMIAGYEAARRFGEEERKTAGFTRVEQFEQWFFASAPGNPVLLRCLEIVREKFLWKVQRTVELTGPGSFSDAVHEFLASDAEGQEMTPGVKKEVSYRTDHKHDDHNDQHFRNLAFRSESEYRAGNWNLWLLASGRTAVPGCLAMRRTTQAIQLRP